MIHELTTNKINSNHTHTHHFHMNIDSRVLFLCRFQHSFDIASGNNRLIYSNARINRTLFIRRYKLIPVNVLNRRLHIIYNKKPIICTIPVDCCDFSVNIGLVCLIKQHDILSNCESILQHRHTFTSSIVIIVRVVRIVRVVSE